MRKLLAILMALALAMGCAAALAGVEDGEDYGTGDAALDDLRNKNPIGERELLVVSGGSAFNDSRRLDIGGIEAAIDAATWGCGVRRGFTDQQVIDGVERRDGMHIDSLTEALNRAAANGVATLVVQPTELIHNDGYDGIVGEVADRAGEFGRVVVGEPLLAVAADYGRVADVLASLTEQLDEADALVFIVRSGDAAICGRMRRALRAKGATRCLLCFPGDESSIESAIRAARRQGCTRVLLRDLAVAHGEAAGPDGIDADAVALAVRFREAGFAAERVPEGLGRLPGIQKLYVERAQAALAAAEAK